MKTKKTQMFDALMGMPVDWIKKSLDNPNPYMTPMCLALHRLALRRKGVTA